MKRRVAFISEHASPLALLGGVDSGGQNVYVDQVARHLVKIGYEVDVFTRWDNLSVPKVVEYIPGVRVVHASAGPKKVVPKEDIFQYMDDFAQDMIAFIGQENISYELVHAHFWMSGYVAVQLKKVLNIPFVITFHALGKVRKIYQGSADKFPEDRINIEMLVSQEADMVIAECPQDKEDLMVHYFVDEKKIKIIPCGFDRGEFYPMEKNKIKQELGISPSELVILQLGRMVPRKGVDNVVKALGALARKVELPVRLLIVGGESEDPDPRRTPEIGRLTEIAKKEKVLDKITFVGRKTREQLKYFYNAADVFVSTPWYEPFGITPLEAMACGTPVIGSNVGGIKYSVDHGHTGFLVPANEPDVLAERLYQILANPDVLKQFSMNALSRVNKLFTWETVTKDIAGLYEHIKKNQKELSKKMSPSFTARMSIFKQRPSINNKALDNKTYEYGQR